MLMIAVVLVGLISLICIYFALLSFMATRPDNLGVRRDGSLAPCSEKPNCVATEATDPEQLLPPFTFTGKAPAAWEKLVSVIKSDPAAEIITQTDEYLYVEYRSKIFRFVDDVEFVLEAPKHVIRFRSASRAGYSDLGVNRARIESIRRRFADLSP